MTRWVSAKIFLPTVAYHLLDSVCSDETNSFCVCPLGLFLSLVLKYMNLLDQSYDSIDSLLVSQVVGL